MTTASANNTVAAPAQPNNTTSMDADKKNKLLDKLIHRCAAIADSQGGIVSLGLLTQETKEMLDQLPEGEENRLAKILGRYNDYFQVLPDQMVATYLAYESGLVDENGKVQKSKLRQKEKMKKVLEVNPDEPEEVQQLSAAAHGLFNACFELQGSTFEEWVSMVRQERAKMIDGGILSINYTPNKPSIIANGEKVEHLSAGERQVKIEQTLRELVCILEQCPDKQCTISKLAQMDSVLAIKKGAISKFQAFIQANPNTFQIVDVEPPKQPYVKLVLDPMTVAKFVQDRKNSNLAPLVVNTEPKEPTIPRGKRFGEKGKGKGKGHNYDGEGKGMNGGYRKGGGKISAGGVDGGNYNGGSYQNNSWYGKGNNMMY